MKSKPETVFCSILIDEKGNLIGENDLLSCKKCKNQFFEKVEEIKFLESTFDYWLNTKWRCIDCGNIEDTCNYINLSPPLPNPFW